MRNHSEAALCFLKMSSLIPLNFSEELYSVLIPAAADVVKYIHTIYAVNVPDTIRSRADCPKGCVLIKKEKN